ncbi:MAG TPA: hypothetical protein PLG34_08265 [Spirochaetota bacterium]|jgi:hypothetical protein|nr:hypothetical protein [Spirochaetota bacterium]HPY87959.1 hypothetical protein [Spirochaetota bacterium]
MALQIKSTPTLHGKEAIFFEKNANENINKKTSKDKIIKNLDMFKKVISNSKNIL